MADETKAANHIDFTSVPYTGPSLVKGQELLAGVRAEAGAEVTSLQKGWYYSGQLDQMVIWEKGALIAYARPAAALCRAAARGICRGNPAGRPSPPAPARKVCSARARRPLTLLSRSGRQQR